MTIFQLVGTAGGLGLFIYGSMNLMSDGFGCRRNKMKMAGHCDEEPVQRDCCWGRE